MLTTNDIAKCESWFDDHGLPYFVESGHEAIQRALAPRIVGLWALVAVVPAVVVTVVALNLDAGAARPWPRASLVAAVVALGRAVRVFRVGRIGRWALAHAWENRSLIGPSRRGRCRSCCCSSPSCSSTPRCGRSRRRCPDRCCGPASASSRCWRSAFLAPSFAQRDRAGRRRGRG